MEMSHIAIIGAGNMAKALVVGLMAMGYPATQLTVSGLHLEKLQSLQQQYGISVTQDNAEAIQEADVVIFAVKPDVIALICRELKSTLTKKRPLIISVAAGVTTQFITHCLVEPLGIVRAMPNIPATVLAGATGLYANEQTSELQKEQAETLFRAVGVTIWVNKESDIDLVTAVSGSGPAYYFLMMEAMQETACHMGLDNESSRLLCLQTVLGAARMALESDHDIATLRQSVTSPKGTTEAALHVFEQGGIKQLFTEAMRAAFNRAQELALEIKKG